MNAIFRWPVEINQPEWYRERPIQMKIFFNPTAPQNEGLTIPVPDADHGTGFTVILATKPGT